MYKPVNSTYIYDVNEAKVIKILEGHRSAAIKFTHDGRYFATVDFFWGKERISLWDAQSFERIGTIYERETPYHGVLLLNSLIMMSF